jgi:hypothetical protein
MRHLIQDHHEYKQLYYPQLGEIPTFNCTLAVRHRKKGGVMLQIKKKMALLGSFNPPWRAEHKWLSVVFHFKIFFGENLNPKVHDLDVY